MPSLTFEPLRRNRYRVHGAPRRMVVKKSQIKHVRRMYEGRAGAQRQASFPPSFKRRMLGLADPDFNY